MSISQQLRRSLFILLPAMAALSTAMAQGQKLSSIDTAHDRIIQPELLKHPSYFDIKDIPEISDKRPLRIVVEQGIGKSLLEPYIIPKFSAHTGINVEVIELTLEQMSTTQRESVLNLNSHYDLVSLEGSWARSWADQSLVYALPSLAERFESVDALNQHTSAFYSSITTLMTYERQLYALPYTNYTMVSHYRSDLFTHPQEQQTFEAKYGYPLAPPQDAEQLLDVAEFFTRKSGELLAGKALEAPFYGVTLMAGYAPHIGDEFSSILWGMGGAWFTPSFYSDSNRIDGFYVNNENPEFLQTAKLYKQMLKYAPPQALSSSWPQSVEQFSSGQVAIYPFAYNNLWKLNAQVVEQVPQAQIGAAQVPLGQPYFGGYGIAVPIDARNVEGAYWLAKFMTSFEAQFSNALDSGSPTRIDVVTHPYFLQPEQHLVSGGFEQGHIALLNWQESLWSKGHYTCIAMQHIYHELQEISYAVASQRLSPEFALSTINRNIRQAHNRHGRSPVKIAPIKE